MQIVSQGNATITKYNHPETLRDGITNYDTLNHRRTATVEKSLFSGKKMLKKYIPSICHLIGLSSFNIMKTRLLNYIENSPPKTVNFQIKKKSDIFHFLLKT